MAVQIDPKTGERIEDAPQIDPQTGERVAPVAGAGPMGTPQPPSAPAPSMAKYAGNLETIPSNADPGIAGGIKTGVHNFGARVANNGIGLLKPFVHPVQTGNEILQRGAFPITPDAIKSASYNPSGPDAGATAANVLGDIATAGLLHKAGGVAAPIGEAAQDSGAGLMNKTIGALKPDFKRGANPAKAYFEAGGGPALSMQSLADKGASLRDSVGSTMGDMRNSATNAGVKIPVAKVAGALNPAIAKGIDLETGAGGLGNTGSIEDYSASFRPDLQSGAANGGITPNGLYDINSRIGKNTNWSDPTQFNLKAIRQQNNGALSGVENEAIPEIAPLKSQYQGLKKFSARAGDRAATNSMPLTSLMGKSAMSGGGALAGGLFGLETGHSPLMTIGGGLAGLAADSVPVKSALASGMYYGGKLLTTPPARLPGVSVAPYDLATQQRKKDKK